MTFSSNCCVRYNPKDSLVILIRNSALTKYGIISHDLAKNHKNISLVQPAKMLPKTSYSIWPKIIHSPSPESWKLCVRLLMLKHRGKCSQDVARQEAFPGGWPDIVVNICNFLLKMSQGFCKFKNREEGKGWGEKERFHLRWNKLLGKKPLMSWFWARPLFFQFV